MGNEPSPRTIPLRSVFLLALLAMIVLPLIPLTVVTLNEYHADVRRIENEIQSTNHQIAELAGRSFQTLLSRIAVALIAPDLSPESVAGLPFRQWEDVDADGRIVRSTLDPGRVDRPFAPDSDWHRVTLGWRDQPFDLSPVTKVPGTGESTLLVRVPLESADAAYRIAFLDAAILHQWLSARYPSFLNRQVFLVDRSGRAVFSSQVEHVTQPDALAANPPVRLFLSGGKGSIRYHSTLTGTERVAYVHRIDEPDLAMVVSVDLGERLLDLRHRMLYIAFAAAIGGALAIGVFVYFRRRVIDPLVGITSEIRRKSRPPHAPLDPPKTIHRIRELHLLATDFNEQIRRLGEAEREAVQAEKLATLGELTAGLAHEIGTPLNVMRGNAQFVIGKLDPADPARPVLEKIVDQTARIADLIRDLLALARSDQPSPGPTEVRTLIDRAVATTREMYPKVDIAVRVGDNLPKIAGHLRRFEHALINLLVNACQATEGGGRVEIEAEAAAIREAPGARITVADDGCGIRPEDLEKVFKPFFSTKPSGRGSGLGLAFVDRVVRENGGTVRVESRVEAGTRFTLELCGWNPSEERGEIQRG